MASAKCDNSVKQEPVLVKDEEEEEMMAHEPLVVSGCANRPSISMEKYEEFFFETPPEAPTFEPTFEEFKNPLTYIAKIRPIAEKYGICKIRPPPTWQPPFTVDVDKLKFTPRVQRINELEAKTRIKLNFLDQIAKFWELQGSALKIPMVERKALDLYTLHRFVTEEGGLEQVTRDRKWTKIASRMGYPIGKSIGGILKGHYERILYPFDVYTTGKTIDSKLESESDDQDYKPHKIVARQAVQPPTETTARRSKRFLQQQKSDPTKKEDETESPVPPQSPKKMQTRTPEKPKGRCYDHDPLAKYICHICERGDVEESMLLCDGCDDSYHTFCLMPPLVDIPKGEWRCPKCVVEEVNKPVEAFGFEQAQREYTLQQFGEMADSFKSDYFNMPVHMVPTNLVEKEFWRIVSCIDEDVTVEYGADLHSMEHGSGFPTKSSTYVLQNDQEYAESSWNLNNLPVLEESILGHINADISGMKVPWMYVGMCFATFCWHNEDHWSYSINYLHWGEPKTWYGVPGSKAEAFEDCMKRSAPELFASQPDLLHQLVTILNPNILMKTGVPVYRTDQSAGDFVVTFPRAYHAGFNQGYNFAEAVNFAPADWLKMGRECVNHYSTLRRFCVFSHDELVCKMALDPDKLNLGIATACYLDMAEMVDTEKKLRKGLLEWGVTKAEREAFELLPDDERQCEICKTTCFLSAVTCSCPSGLACLRHYTELCKCPPEKHILKYRYTLDELPLMLRKLKVKAESFEIWLTKVRNILDPAIDTKITLAELQALASEAETKKFPSSVILDRLNSAVLEAEKCVTVIQQLDINKIRTRTRNSTDMNKYKLSITELDMFVQEIDNLCCIILEGNSVRELQRMGKNFIETATSLLKQPIKSVKEHEIQATIDEGSSLCVELPQIKALKDRLQQVTFYNNCRIMRDTHDKLPLNIIVKLLQEGMQCVPCTMLEKELAELHKIMSDVQAWEAAAKDCIENGTQHQIPDIEDLLAKSDEIEGVLPSEMILRDSLKKAKDWLKSVEVLQENETYPYFHSLESVVKRGKTIPLQLKELKKIEMYLGEARNWKEKTARTFLKKYSSFSLIDALAPRCEALMLPAKYRKRHGDENFAERFPDEVTQVQMVNRFKAAEETEKYEMDELRKQNQAKNPESDTYCICKRKFSGIMFNCQLCRDWFHSGCVPLPKNMIRSSKQNAAKAKQLEPDVKYLCPSCCRSRRPRLETILQLLVSLQRLPIRLPEGEALQCLTERAMSWQDTVRTVLSRDDIAPAVEKVARASQKSEQQQAARDKSDKIINSEMKKVAKLKENRRLKKIHLTSEKSEASENDENRDDHQSATEPCSDIKSDDSSDPSSPAHHSEAPMPQVSPSNGKSTVEPMITLEDTTREIIEKLMMEGDLLEVSLEETQQLWQILVAAKATMADLNYMYTKYNITPGYPNENNLVTPVSKKRKSSEITQMPSSLSKKTSKKAAAEAKKLNGNTSLSETNVLTPQNKNTSTPPATNNSGRKSTIQKQQKLDEDDDAHNNKDDSANDEHETEFEDNPDADKQPRKKLKRGRKMKLIKETNEASPLKKKKPRKASEKGAAAAAAAAAQEKGQSTTTTTTTTTTTSSNVKKSAKVANQSMTSDEDEECSASNCSRPPGIEVDWIQCDGGCNKWFHMLCVGLDKRQVKPDDDYICKICKKSNTSDSTSAVD